ncbi:MAG TPA: HAMP domain-containing sensor histidine kinase [Polyangiaceae bacterium]
MDSTAPASDGQLALLDDLRQRERRAIAGLVASVLGHMIGTPLHVIAGRASLIRTNPTSENALENAKRIEEQVERLAQRIRGLIEYLTVPEAPVEPWSVARVVEETLAICRPIASDRGLALSLDGESIPEANLDGSPTILVLTSLLSLAMRSAKDGAAIALAISLAPPGAIQFELDVPGMDTPRGRIDRLEPPDDWQQSGADQLQVLSLCFAIARRHGGQVTLEKRDSGGGTVLRLRSAVTQS